LNVMPAGQTQRRLGERRFRLHREAKKLDPRPEVLPYYLHGARSKHERAPGWYVHLAGHEFPYYLADNSVDAEIELRAIREREGDAAA
jgi:hypothetical protein